MDTFLREILRFSASSREQSVEWQICSHLRKHGIRYLGNTDAGKGYCFIRPAPDMSVVFGCYAGRGQVLIDQQWQWCGPGHVFLTPAHVPHAYRAVPGTRWGIVWVAYEAGSREPPVVRVAEPVMFQGDSTCLRTVILGLCREVRALSPNSTAISHWVDLVDCYARQLAARESPFEDPRLNRLWMEVEGGLARPWTLDDLSRRAHVSREQLRCLCRRQFGHSPMEHLAHLRMHRAVILITRTTGKIHKIARDVGYQDSYAFSTAFHRHFGVTPSSLRKAQH